MNEKYTQQNDLSLEWNKSQIRLRTYTDTFGSHREPKKGVSNRINLGFKCGVPDKAAKAHSHHSPNKLTMAELTSSKALVSPPGKMREGYVYGSLKSSSAGPQFPPQFKPPTCIRLGADQTYSANGEIQSVKFVKVKIESPSKPVTLYH